MPAMVAVSIHLEAHRLPGFSADSRNQPIDFIMGNIDFRFLVRMLYDQAEDYLLYLRRREILGLTGDVVLDSFT